MMTKPFLFLPLLLIPVESSLLSIPLFFILGVAGYVYNPGIIWVLSVFIGSIVLDALRMAPLGLSGLFLVAVFMVIEILKGDVVFSDYKIIAVFLFAASFAYAKLLNYSGNVLIYLIFFLFLYAVFSYFIRSKEWLK